MCLGVPGRILSINDCSLMQVGTVDFGGVTREVCLDLVPEAQVGDYVIVHTGFAISRLKEEETQDTLALMREAGFVVD